MSNEALVNLPKGNILERIGEDSLGMILQGSFLPRLQLFTAFSSSCKDGSFPINHWGLVTGGSTEDLGTNVDVLLLSVRPLAIDDPNGSPVFCYSPVLLDAEGQPVIRDGKKVPDPVFEAIVRKADTKVEGEMPGAMYGVDFLVWIPSRKTYATLFYGTKTARRDAGFAVSRIGKMVTLTSKKIESKKYKPYYSIYAIDCSTIPPVEALPQEPSLTDELQKFNNPPKTELPEKAEAAPTREM
jgi:hypothetical protein